MKTSFSIVILACFSVVVFASGCNKKSHSSKTTANSNSTTHEASVLKTRTYNKEGFTLVFKNNDPSFNPRIRDEMVKTFFIVYPEEVKRFNPKASKKVTFAVDTAYSGVAATSGAKVRLSAAYFHAHPKDIDVVTHEVMHIVQSYPQYKPVWLVEGIADYVRYIYGVNNAAGGWSLPGYSPSQSYTDSYRVTARFLVWLQNHVNDKIVDKLDASLRSGKYYKVNMWKAITGKTLDELWAEYGENPSLK